LTALRNTFRSFPKFVPQGGSPAEIEWTGNMNELARLVREDDPRCFLRWDIVQFTMFPVFAPYSLRELKTLRRSPRWPSRWKEAVRETATGCPIPYVFYPSSSCNLVHMAYHLHYFESMTQRDIVQSGLVVEFGAGYGRMCALFQSLGFSGKYICFDLPPFSALQRYYLACSGHRVLSEEEFANAAQGVICVSDPQQLQRLLDAHASVPGKAFVATWSLSETPVPFRNSIQNFVGGFDMFLMAYQHVFKDIDNAAAFASWKAAIPGVDWRDIPVPFLGGSNYLFGERKP